MPENGLTELIEDILSDECPKGCGGYCIIKEILLHLGMEPRKIVQLKCIEKFKYEESERINDGVGLTLGDAISLWVERGHAKKFNEVYQEGMKFLEAYALTLGKND